MSRPKSRCAQRAAGRWPPLWFEHLADVDCPSKLRRIRLATDTEFVHGDLAMDAQRYGIRGRVVSSDDPALQDVLALIHDSPERPRCLCVPGGVEMYVARYSVLVVKRMPDTGSRHHPSCPSFEPDPASSGLGELIGDAVRELPTGRIELAVDFPWARVQRTGASRVEPEARPDVLAQRRRLSLRALTHFLFERAGLNRWTPGMAGKRNQGVLHKYLTEAAREVHAIGEPLAQRLYVPEPFHESTHRAAAQRRRELLKVLAPTDGRSPLALVLGEFKAVDDTTTGHRVWIRHMPDAPLLVDRKSWQRVVRRFACLFEAREADTAADTARRVRLVVTALIRARREHTYEIDTASLMLASEDWIPVEGVHELPLVQALIERGRRFVKPLRYDAVTAAGFANALLLDVDATPLALHVFSAFMSERDRTAKEAAVRACCNAWVWPADAPTMPALPEARP